MPRQQLAPTASFSCVAAATATTCRWCVSSVCQCIFSLFLLQLRMRRRTYLASLGTVMAAGSGQLRRWWLPPRAIRCVLCAPAKTTLRSVELCAFLAVLSAVPHVAARCGLHRGTSSCQRRRVGRRQDGARWRYAYSIARTALDWMHAAALTCRLRRSTLLSSLILLLVSLLPRSGPWFRTHAT